MKKDPNQHKCYACKGSKRKYDPRDPYDTVEGIMMRGKLPCLICEGKGVLSTFRTMSHLKWCADTYEADLFPEADQPYVWADPAIRGAKQQSAKCMQSPALRGAVQIAEEKGGTLRKVIHTMYVENRAAQTTGHDDFQGLAMYGLGPNAAVDEAPEGDPAPTKETQVTHVHHHTHHHHSTIRPGV